MLDGELDAAIIAQPPFAIPKACDWQVLREEPLIVLTPGSMRNRDPHAILASEPLIRQRPNSWVGRLIDGYLRQAGIRPRDRFDIDTLDAVAVMVDRGLGVALVHDWAPPWPEGLALMENHATTQSVWPAHGPDLEQSVGPRSPRTCLLEVAVEALAAERAGTPKPKSLNRRRARKKAR